MAVKQVQRYIRLNELVPDLMALMDAKKLGFTTAVELSYISKKSQNYIAVAIDSQQSSPSQAQAKRMRELDSISCTRLVNHVLSLSDASSIEDVLKEFNAEYGKA